MASCGVIVVIMKQIMKYVNFVIEKQSRSFLQRFIGVNIAIFQPSNTRMIPQKNFVLCVAVLQVIWQRI